MDRPAALHHGLPLLLLLLLSLKELQWHSQH
jgi:hypothetical protein